MSESNRMPHISPKRVRGLAEIVSMVRADLKADPDRYRRSGDEWAAVHYLDDLVRYHERRYAAKYGGPQTTEADDE